LQHVLTRLCLCLTPCRAALLEHRPAFAGDRRLHEFDQHRQRGLRVGGHQHVNRHEPLEVLVICLGVELDAVDVNDLYVRTMPRLHEAVAVVLAVINPAAQGAPDVGQLQTQDHVGVADRLRP
jgi:hypothetical protein